MLPIDNTRPKRPESPIFCREEALITLYWATLVRDPPLSYETQNIHSVK